MGIWSHCGKGKVCFSTWDSSKGPRNGICAGTQAGKHVSSDRGRSFMCPLTPNAASRETNQASKEPQRTARGNSVVTGKHEGNECVVVVSHPAASLGEVIILYLTYLRLRALSLDNIDVINGSSY